MAPQRNTTNQQQRQQPAADSTAAGPAARTRAAVRQQQHQQQQHAVDMVLPLLLQHDSVRTRLRLVCSLLCCSKAVAAAVAEHCAGQLDIPWQATAAAATEGQQQKIAAWLRKHARLVRSLDLPRARPADVPAALVAAGPQNLQLQSLMVYHSSSSTLLLLEQLPAHSLTQLACEVVGWAGQPHDLLACVARLSAALGRLTGLRALALDTSGCGSLGLPGLSGLSQLTSLRCQGPPPDLQHAPPQLLRLDLQYLRRWPDQPLELSHLTGLTALTCTAVKEDDVLPPHLLELRVFKCGSVPLLLGLQRLQQLELQLDEQGQDVTADQLLQLSSLSALSLDYNEGGIEPGSAAAWPLLPLQRLAVCGAHLSASVCQSLAQLSGLTSLRLWFKMPHGAASAQQLATALRRLSGLQQLQLSSTQWGTDAAAVQSAAQGMRQLAQAVGSLQQLRGLNILHCQPLAAAVAAAPCNSLTALTGLTGLSLAWCDLNDAAVASIVSQLPPGLKNLDCLGNLQLTDAELPAIGRLTQLTELSLKGTRATDAGLQHLSGLVRLRKLDVCCTRVTDAGMHHLTGLAQLQELVVPDCVSQAQKRWLQQRLPDLLCWVRDIMGIALSCFVD